MSPLLVLSIHKATAGIPDCHHDMAMSVFLLDTIQYSTVCFLLNKKRYATPPYA
jgi:hypothetical protein